MYDIKPHETEIDRPMRVTDYLAMDTLDLSGTDRASVMRRVTLSREAFGLSQAELCRQIGISAQSWGHYEKLRNALPTDIAIKISSKLAVSLDWIYQGLEYRLPPEVATRLAAIRSAERRRA